MYLRTPIFLTALLSVACSGSSNSLAPTNSDAGVTVDSATLNGDQGNGDVTPVDNPTYHGHIKQILADNCVGCHRQGGPGGFDVSTYAGAKTWAAAIYSAAAARTMPPWGAFESDDCAPRFPLQGDLRLTDAEIRTLGTWADNGQPEGDAGAFPDPDVREPDRLEQWDFEGQAMAPISVQDDGDSFVCIVIDPGLTEETWLSGIEFVPDNKSLVHHVVLFTDPTQASLELMNEDGTYSCFGSAGVPGGVAAAWAPGISARKFPEDMAMRVTPGTLFVMQMHYSPQGGAETLLDQTKLRFQYAATPPRYEVFLQLIGNFDFMLHPAFGLVGGDNEGPTPNFFVPAGQARHKESMRWTYDGRLPGRRSANEGLGDMRLLGIAPHMHYAGVEMEVRLERPAAGTTACEPGMVTGLFGCAVAEGCLEADDALECSQNRCQTQYDAMSVSCWGCFQTATVGPESQQDFFAKIQACETDVVPEYEGEQPPQECLINAPKYSFEWQRFYQYDAPFEQLPVVTPGSVMSIDCTYNNSMSNPLIQSALARLGMSAPTDVVLGDETLDEMCLVALLLAAERPER
ncbi:MAG: hypothetical protein VYA30_01815 [Myxococcota bacterium]|nr:hypothetical protein [Myxococcota bacterium]